MADSCWCGGISSDDEGEGMSKNDLMVFGFITLWIILTAGKPDVLDGITSLLMQGSCDVKRLEVLKGE